MYFGDSVGEREQKIRVTPHCIPNMDHSMTVWDQRSELEFTKDWNGIGHVTLKAPRGASARVRFSPFYLPTLFIHQFFFP